MHRHFDKLHLCICLANSTNYFQCYKLGFYGPKYVWILIGWYGQGWWNDALTYSTCTVDQILEVIEGHFATGESCFTPRT